MGSEMCIRDSNHAECIRCGMCMKACPTDAIQYKFGLGDQSNTETVKE